MLSTATVPAAPTRESATARSTPTMQTTTRPSVTTRFLQTSAGVKTRRSADQHSNTVRRVTTPLGSSALNSVTSGVNNTAVGFNALAFSHGNYNTAIGQNAGDLLVVGSSNIYIGNEGVDVDSNTIRIGTECNTIGCPGQQFVT